MERRRAHLVGYARLRGPLIVVQCCQHRRHLAVRAVLAKGAPGERKTDEELDHAIRQIVSRAVVSDEVLDIFASAGLKKPDISILSDEFLAEVRGMPQRNLAVELLQKLLKGEIRARRKRNVVQARSFAELLEQAVRSTRTVPSRRHR